MHRKNIIEQEQKKLALVGPGEGEGEPGIVSFSWLSCA